MMKTKENHISLVLCGGGAKGAYQIGVWRYLKEHGYKIDGISGVSVGAMNALLIVQDNLELAEHVWKTVRQTDFTCPRAATGDRTNIELLDLAIPALELYFMEHGGSSPALFSQRRLKNVIYNSIEDWNSITERKDLYVCVAKVGDGTSKDSIYMELMNRDREPEYINLAGRRKDQIVDYILASAAIPLVFKSRVIDGNRYIDGGWADNIPATPLLESGYRKIAIIHLQNETVAEQMARANSLKGWDLSACDILDIYPSVYINPEDTVKIDHERIDELMKCGYEDAKRALEKGNIMSGFSYEEFDYDMAYKEMIEQIKRPNIFLCGRTGAGKSSLVNDIFNLSDEHKASVGKAKPETRGIHEYKSGNIVLLDTEGFEIGHDKEFKKEIIGEIDRRIKEYPLQMEKHIHGAWYLVNSGEKRFLDKDRDIITEIEKRGIPVMIVLTKVDTVDEEELDSLKREVHSQCPGNVCYTYSIMADKYGWDEETRNAYVQKTEMVAWAKNHLPDNLQSAFMRAVKGEIALKRQFCMHKIVLPHTLMATAAVTGTSLVNVPFTDSMPLMTIQIKMVMNILSEYGIKADMGTIIKDLTGSTLISYIGRTLASQIVGIIPYTGQVVKGIVNVSVATSITAVLGASVAYMCEGYLGSCIDNNGVANMEFLKYFTSDNIKSAMKYVSANKKEFYIDDIINEAGRKDH